MINTGFALKWYKNSEKEFNCPHVNKCDVVISAGDEVYLWNTDKPAPDGDFMWVFVNDLLEGKHLHPNRTYIQCDCKVNN